MDYVRFLFGFKGRINRIRYLAVQLTLLAVGLIIGFKFPFSLSSPWEALHWVVAITMIWVSTATTARRLHDRNWSGWWAVAVLIVNRLTYLYYGHFFGLSFGVDIPIAEELLLVMLAAALSLLQTWIVIELFFLMGTDGPNRFGPDPVHTAPNSSVAPSVAPAGVPDFLVRRGPFR